MRAQEKAQSLLNWVSSTQFNLFYNNQGELISHKKLTDLARYRAKTYVDFLIKETKGKYDIFYWEEVRDEIDKCYFSK